MEKGYYTFICIGLHGLDPFINETELDRAGCVILKIEPHLTRHISNKPIPTSA